jgi:penicillin amidase/acyl-homoserine-lactone acylase
VFSETPCQKLWQNRDTVSYRALKTRQLLALTRLVAREWNTVTFTFETFKMTLACFRAAHTLLAVVLLTLGYSFNALALDASIERDPYGVPHVYGETDADAAFGLAYAQAEDAWPIMEGSLPFFRGNAGLYEGQEGAQSDYLVKWLDLWGTLDRDYERVLTPEIRAYVEAFAAGFNAFARDHTDEIKHPELLPVTGKDIVAGHMLRHPLFYGFEGPVLELFGDTRPNTQGAHRIQRDRRCTLAHR